MTFLTVYFLEEILRPAFAVHSYTTFFFFVVSLLSERSWSSSIVRDALNHSVRISAFLVHSCRGELIIFLTWSDHLVGDRSRLLVLEPSAAQWIRSLFLIRARKNWIFGIMQLLIVSVEGLVPGIQHSLQIKNLIFDFLIPTAVRLSGIRYFFFQKAFYVVVE